MKTYKELIVWQKSFDLAIDIYTATKKFPKEELFEGNTRGGTKEYVQFLRIAYSSAAELENQLLISEKLGLINSPEYITINGLLTEVMKMLRTIITKLSI